MVKLVDVIILDHKIPIRRGARTLTLRVDTRRHQPTELRSHARLLGAQFHFIPIHRNSQILDLVKVR